MRFMRRLVGEKKIQLVESSEDISQSYTKKSENSLKAAKLLLENDLYEESVSMSYYSMFHKTMAVLRVIGIKCENHSAAIILLKEIFGIDNEDIKFAKEERVDKQYYTDADVTRVETKRLVESAEKFIAEVDFFLDGLDENSKRIYIEKLKLTLDL